MRQYFTFTLCQRFGATKQRSENLKIMKPAFSDDNNFVLRAKGKYMEERFLLLFFQEPKGLIKVYAAPLANDGIDSRMAYIGSGKANNYHCDKCSCSLSEEQISKIAQDWCEQTESECSQEEYDNDEYYTFISIDKVRHAQA